MKRILVTGANKGIGLATVENLLKNNQDTFIILSARDSIRGTEAAAKLISKESDWKDRLFFMEMDVSSDASVNNAAQQIMSKFHPEHQLLFGLINNAGIGSSEIGMEATLEVNAFGIQRVCEAFIPLLDPQKGRIVNVTSAAGPNFVEVTDNETRKMLTDPNVLWESILEFMNQCIALENKSDATTSTIGNAYGLSKACANALTLILAREHPGLTINACTPGFIETDLTHPFAVSLGKKPEKMGMKTPEQGSSSIAFLMMDEIQGSGMYFGSDCLRSPLDRYRSPGDHPYEGT